MKREYLYVKKFVKYPKQNKDLKRILYCLAEKYGKIKNGSVQYKAVKKLIIEECSNNFCVYITYKQINRLLKIRRRYPYKALVILMAIYNLLKRENYYSNEPEVEELINYIMMINGDTLLYQEFCLKRELPQKVYNHIDYANDIRYRNIYEGYVATYEVMEQHFGNMPFLKICQRNFEQSEFDSNDIFERMKK